MRSRLSIRLACLLIGFLSPAVGAETLPAPLRFATADTSDVPDFQKHVVPLLGRLGCNGRNCHGSFQGRGDFRLSLFGYDFKMDHAALTAAASSGDGLRTNRQQPGHSLVVMKPSLQVDHEGGKRFERGSWEHHLLQRWIAAGAPGVTTPKELDRLEIEPREVLFDHSHQPIQLRVEAVWEDDSREDVTSLCRFRTNDDTIVTVDSEGRIQSTGVGDSHVIAFYDNGVAAVPVMRPLDRAGDDVVLPVSASTRIDEFIGAKLRKLGIQPSALCSDAEFLRRASIDVTGSLPTPEEVEAFIADPAPEKRKHKIDQLLERPGYAACWTNKLCDFTGCNPNQQAELGQETAVQWYMWIYQRIEQNMPYDQLVERIVTAVGREEGQSFTAYCDQVSSYFREDSKTAFAERDTMPHYWTRRTVAKPEDKALGFAHSFLGLRLQCAQCHKHPFASWTQRDFNQFADFFSNVKYGVQPSEDQQYRQLAKQVGLNVRGNDGSPVRRDVLFRARGKSVPWRELYIALRETPTTLNLLRSGQVELDPSEDPRARIMQWMKQEDNPWFARALVNRVWATYFHIGIVDPPDDLNPANPPSNPALLDWLTSSFVRHQYDMKWLHRTIVSSDAYQRSWKPNETNRSDLRNFSRAIPRRIPAEVVYDAVKQALASAAELDQVRADLSRRASGHLSMRLAGTYAMRVFGKPERALNCDCERVNQPTLLQSVFLQNDPLIDQRLNESGWIQEISRMESSQANYSPNALVRTAWLRTLNRPPTRREIDRATAHLASVDSVAEGMRDLLWALLNTKEFILNR